MEHKHACKDFRCPEYVNSNEPDDFCIPAGCCPEVIPQPKYPSPTSCLPEEELEELEKRIEEANHLLLDLALSGKREPNEVFKGIFDRLKGKFVSVITKCPSLNRKKMHKVPEGVVCLVGQDFVLLKVSGGETLIPFEQILSVKTPDCPTEGEDEPEFLNLDPCLRRALTFNFGELVSSSPELIQVFFRLNLKVYLLMLVGKKIEVTLEKRKISGVICDVYEESFVIKGKRKIETPLSKICMLTIL